MTHDSPTIDAKKVLKRIGLSQESETAFMLEEWLSFFGFVVDGIAVSGGDGDVEERRSRILSWLLREPADGRGLSLRYLCNPERQSLCAFVMNQRARSFTSSTVRASGVFTSPRT